MNVLTPLLCFVACHTGPAEHFATFIKALSSQQISYKVIADDLQQKIFADLDIPFIPFSNDVEKVALLCMNSSVVITDVGHSSHIALHQLLEKKGHAHHYAYYDNPESNVPGGYSDLAKQVMQVASGALFANRNFSEQCRFSLEGKPIASIGYYPWLKKQETLRAQRETFHQEKKAEYLRSLSLQDRAHHILLYMGGNNETYYQNAFPAMLSIIGEASEKEDLHDLLLILQQHPAARKNPLSIDRHLWNRAQIIFQMNPKAPLLHLSEQSTDELLLIADTVCYYQTSLSPLFQAAGLSYFQIGHIPYEESLVKLGVCPVITSADDFLHFVSNPHQLQNDDWMAPLGADPHWEKNLFNFIHSLTKELR